jgi:energy-coupling factor transport system substrate-specific component
MKAPAQVDSQGSVAPAPRTRSAVGELLQVWSNTRMVVLTAISAAAYVAVLLPFKGFVIIPGLTEVRPGAAIPVVLSFLFGPAAAWGSGLGNLIADALGGMLGPGSLFGFVGNFIYGYLPYALWRAFMGHANPVRSGVKGWLVFGVAVVTACMAIGAIIGWGMDLLRMAPFAALGLIIAVNNLIAASAIGAVLLALLYARVGNWGLLYYQIMEEDTDVFPGEAPAVISPRPPSGRSRLALLGAVLVIGGTAFAFISGLLISAEGLGVGYGAAAFAAEAKGTAAVAAGMAPGLLVLLVGAALL